ncbi:hypothetical protein HNV12_01775 [Methanococcoides sp. SA1]|nr:hypothetical protein [Methanococcoides sp. SA1]
MTNIYINERRELIKKCRNDLEMNMILETVYDDGYNDGACECREKLKKVKA